MSELPQATSRRELREREQAAKVPPRAAGRAPKAAHGSAHAASGAPNRHRIVSKFLSLGAMAFVGALVIGLSVPANAFSPDAATGAGAALAAETGIAAPAGAGASAGGSSGSQKASAADIQSASVDDDQPASVTGHDGFLVLSWAQVLAQKYSHAGTSIGGSSKGSIRWPFPYPVTISSPFGPRIAPCSGCSSFHEGVDFTPGENAAIFAVAGGVVTGREDASYGYGNYVIITSQLNGHTVRFTYAHMTHGSSPIVLGQTVSVGDFIGLVGETGEATGPHLHFEVNVDGTTIDPIPWLEANVN